jgi:hypothetical protein
MYLLFQQRSVKRAAWREAEVLVDDGGGNVAIRLKGDQCLQKSDKVSPVAA